MFQNVSKSIPKPDLPFNSNWLEICQTCICSWNIACLLISVYDFESLVDYIWNRLVMPCPSKHSPWHLQFMSWDVAWTVRMTWLLTSEPFKKYGAIIKGARKPSWKRAVHTEKSSESWEHFWCLHRMKHDARLIWATKRIGKCCWCCWSIRRGACLFCLVFSETFKE